MSSPTIIDLDAAKRESRNPDGVTVILGGETFLLPGELPADVLDPLLDPTLNLVGLVKQILDDTDTALGDDILEVIFARPDLPANLIGAVKDCFALWFGEDQYPAFVGQRPSFTDYVRLIKAVPSIYGVGLGEAFASAGSSESDGQTSNPTSEPTAEGSTPATSGDTQETPGS